MKQVFEIHIDDDMAHIMSLIRAAADAPISFDELLARWIAKGIAFDGMTSEDNAARLIKMQCRIIHKSRRN